MSVDCGPVSLDLLTGTSCHIKRTSYEPWNLVSHACRMGGMSQDLTHIRATHASTLVIYAGKDVDT